MMKYFRILSIPMLVYWGSESFGDLWEVHSAAAIMTLFAYAMACFFCGGVIRDDWRKP